jgi:hypothetical protein
MKNLAQRLNKGFHNPKFWAKFHAVWTCIWFILIFVTVIWWRESVLWIALMSAWANFAAHLAGYQGSRAERATDTSEQAVS